MPDAKLGKFSVYWWGTANGTQRRYLSETVSEHIILLGRNIAGHTEPVPETSIIFSQTLQDLDAASAAAGNPPYITTLKTGRGFIDQGIIYIWAGNKLEAGQLGHLMMHRVILDPLHLDPRWTTFLNEDWLLSLRIASRR